MSEYQYFPGQLVWAKVNEKATVKRLQFYTGADMNRNDYPYETASNPDLAIKGHQGTLCGYIEPVKIEDLIDYIGPPDLSNEIMKFRYIYIEKFQWLDKPNNNLYTGVNLYLADNTKDHNGRHYSIQWEHGTGQDCEIYKALVNAGEIVAEESPEQFWQMCRKYKVQIERKDREVTKKVMKEACKHKIISPYK